jgi:poly-gamma-glutamate synthesis protein (capsule biosynthesis protein)
MDLLRAGDIAFLNLETNLATRGIPQEKQNVVRADPNVVEDLTFAGIDIVSLANNHMMDYSWAGVEDTIGFVERAGIKCVGVGPDLTAARAPVILNGPGGKIGFLAFSSVLSQSYAAGVGRPGVAAIRVTTAYVVEQPLAMEQPGSPPPVITMAREIDVSATQEAVRALKTQADFVVVSAHWGVPGDELMDYQRDVGRALVDAGADLVLGHHPHRLQGVEYYKGKPILHSVGNFMFCPPPPGSNHPENSFRNRQTVERVYGFFSSETVLLDAQIRGDRLERLTFFPGLINKDGYPELRTDMAEHFVGIVQRLSRGLGTAFRAEDGQVVLAAA